MSTRPDLAALTPDDLAALANRGLVKRAQREVENGEQSAQWSESDDGTLTVAWSDGATWTIPETTIMVGQSASRRLDDFADAFQNIHG